VVQELVHRQPDGGGYLNFMKTKTKMMRIAGGSLLFAAGTIAFLWFYWLAPLRHLGSAEWLAVHSAKGRFAEDQKRIQRFGADHDSSIDVGYFGDKTWTKWVIREINSFKLAEDQMGSCGEWPYHLFDALPDLTNQGMATAADWLEWWQKNKDKTQLEWIRDGFASKGIILQQPLTTNNILALLKLSYLATNSPVFSNTPPNLRSSLRFNAFRWLRDSGFRSIEFDLKNIPEEDRNQITLALIKYAEWSGIHRDDPGKLPINEYSLEHPLPDACFLTPRFRWPLYLTIIAMALGGWYLLRVSRKNMRS
jgi:hypothetical protein